MSFGPEGHAISTRSACRGLVETEVNAQIILRVVAAAAAHLLDLPHRLLAYAGLRLLCACCAVTVMRAPMPVRLLFLPDQPDLDPVARHRDIAAQQLRHGIDAVHHHIHVAIVVEVAERAATRRRLRR